mmetsp:Transcript_20536/g.28580  ORF Transcript_20536/g.28580 Transcript_20536/m.28580 type:complete len:93 (-) Transcript_20536:272-550(-)
MFIPAFQESLIPFSIHFANIFEPFAFGCSESGITLVSTSLLGADDDERNSSPQSIKRNLFSYFGLRASTESRIALFDFVTAGMKDSKGLPFD